ncbi:hypothetical protein BGZ75_001072 [Mortierella antarctica]|nr:hypothetical protein BGZ75_001072 [Mortierella antarctica]
MVATTAAPTVATAPAKIQSSSAFLDLAKRPPESTLECWKECHAKALQNVIQVGEYRSVMDLCTQGLNSETRMETLFAERTCFHDLVDAYEKGGDLKAKFAEATKNAAFCIMYICYRK